MDASTLFRKTAAVMCGYYSLSDINRIYCIATEDVLMIIHLLYKYKRAFHLESMVVASC